MFVCSVGNNEYISFVYFNIFVVPLIQRSWISVSLTGQSVTVTFLENNLWWCYSNVRWSSYKKNRIKIKFSTMLFKIVERHMYLIISQGFLRHLEITMKTDDSKPTKREHDWKYNFFLQQKWRRNGTTVKQFLTATWKV